MDVERQFNLLSPVLLSSNFWNRNVPIRQNSNDFIAWNGIERDVNMYLDFPRREFSEVCYGDWKGIIPSGRPSTVQLACRLFHVLSSAPFHFEGIFRSISGSFSSTSGDDRLVGSPLGFFPLQAGIVSVFDKEDQSCGIQNESSPLKRREGKELEFLAFLLFVIGLWFIYTALGVEQKTIVSISKILIGVIILALGWATEQAALNLMDFGRIDWSHLL